jgi:hypothetical protein
VRVRVANPGREIAAKLVATGPGGRVETAVALAAGGESAHDLLLAEPKQPGDLRVSLEVEGEVRDQREVRWQPPPHLRVHLIQHSHHDVGYTNLPSTVRREHCGFLDQALDFAAMTAHYPDEARFRLVIEQAWSLLEFVRAAPPERVALLGELLRNEEFELTALFGNLTTEICGPEELIRALYPSAQLARRFGCSLVSAEHNDVPGMSWGLAEVLTGAGIRFFAPQLPRYGNWCDPPLQGFWDEVVLFPQGRPGGFWWQAPSGGRVLLWDAHGSGGDVRPDLPDLADRLQALVAGGYRQTAVYWPVRGGARDNSPYRVEFCDTVRAWNERWAFPRLLMSTNARFWAELQPELPAGLPVFSGELPGQDYPVGSLSTAAATAVNRRTQVQLLVGERLATLAAGVTDHEYPAATLDRAYEEVLWFDEHTWGHHFPAGPAAEASMLEKQGHAYRGAALAHEVTTRALARLADHIALPGEGLYLVVYNPLPHSRTAAVVTPLREIESGGSTMTLVTDPAQPTAPGYLRGVPLTDRWPLHPPAEIVAGHFDLVDLTSGARVPFEIVELAADSPVPHAPQRYGLAQGGKRYGFFETPTGLGRDLHFVAYDLPPSGYKTYELKPRPETGPPLAGRQGRDLVIENEYYRLEADRETGRLVSLTDREADCELLDPTAPHALGELVVRSPDGEFPAPVLTAAPRVQAGPLSQRLDLWFSASGHPHLRQTLTLYQGLKHLDLAVRLLKDPTPLLDTHLALPFALTDPRFRYESTLSLQAPLTDYLPGAYWDEVAVQNWVRLTGEGMSLLWSSLDTALVSLGSLTAGYTSPAHRCRLPDPLQRPPGGPEQLSRAWLYSLLTANNFGTNFAVSQTASLLYRYRMTTCRGAMSEAEAVRLGWESVMPPQTVFTEPRRAGSLPLTNSLLSLEGDPLVLLAGKPAEVGQGFILRLWNPSATAATTTVRLGFGSGGAAELVSLTEEAGAVTGAELIASENRSFTLRLAGRSLATVRLGQ